MRCSKCEQEKPEACPRKRKRNREWYQEYSKKPHVIERRRFLASLYRKRPETQKWNKTYQQHYRKRVNTKVKYLECNRRYSQSEACKRKRARYFARKKGDPAWRAHRRAYESTPERRAKKAEQMRRYKKEVIQTTKLLKMLAASSAISETTNQNKTNEHSNSNVSTVRK